MFTTTSDYTILNCPPMNQPPMLTPKWKPNNTIEIAPNCPRCASHNTKFCYYNNYSLSQPRYFCKACRRYWTKGGSLRNVPVGGGCRKTRRSRSARLGGGSSLTSNKSNHGPSSELDGGGTHIDLAAMYAKYVNNNSENDESCSPRDSSTSDIDSQNMEFQYQDLVDLDLINGGDQLQEVIPQVMFTDGQDSIYQTCEDLDSQMQGIFNGDELAGGGALWPDQANLPDFELHQSTTVEMGDFGLFSPDDDQLRMSSSLVSDNWGSFDLSGYEIFSRT